MENFWQQLCSKNIVYQASDKKTASISNMSETNFAAIKLFTLSESEKNVGDSYIPEPEHIKNKRNLSKSVAQKQQNNTKKTINITFKGEKLEIEPQYSLNDDDTMEINYSKKLKDGSILTYNAVANKSGEIVAYRTECHYANGYCEAEFYEEKDNTRPNDKSTKFVKGTETWFEDENGETQEVSYRSECRDKKTGALEIVNDGIGEMSGVREQKRDYYEWANEVYQGTEIERGDEKGINRSCVIEYDKNGQVVFNSDSDTITIYADENREERFSFSTNSFEVATSVKIATYNDTEIVEFDDIPEIQEPTVKTVPEDIIKNGGEIQHVLSDGTTKTEFYKVVDGEIITGYTTIDTESGLVLDDYREVYDVADTKLNNPKSKQQLKYDENTGKHTGEKQVFDTESGMSEYSHSYYIQGVLGETMRYTTGSFDDGHHFVADGNEDTIKFEQAGKEYSVSQLEELLKFQKDY